MTPPTDTPPVTVADPGVPVVPELIQPGVPPPQPPPTTAPRTSEKSLSTAGMLLILGAVVVVAGLAIAYLNREEKK